MQKLRGQQFSYEIGSDRIARVKFDSEGRMNTLSSAAIVELTEVVLALRHEHDQHPLAGVILTGNKHGLGAGADIGELMKATPRMLAGFVDRGHEVLYAIEESPFPWLAVINGVALGGIYELALACHGIIATPESTIGLPEIQLNIFPGLGGTQRLPRRIGLMNPKDPINGDAAFTAILTGKKFDGSAAWNINMVDMLIPARHGDVDTYAANFLQLGMGAVKRSGADLSNAEVAKPMVLQMVQRATMGRSHPRAPYVAIDIMCRGAALPLKDAIRLERHAFVEVATSHEARAGMRLFFTQQTAQKLPRSLPAAEHISIVGVAGIDGFMGNAISWLAREAGKSVIGYVPPAALASMRKTIEEIAGEVREKLTAKYAFAVKKGKYTDAEVAEKVASVVITDNIERLSACELVIEALSEARKVKRAFFQALMELGYEGYTASNSSSMGPGVFDDICDPNRNFNLHFFSPAEKPTSRLVEIVVTDDTCPLARATAYQFILELKKTPLVLMDGSIGFLVNAGLASYMLAAEKLYREGTPIETIDEAMRDVFPMGPFELADFAGVDVAAGMFDEIMLAGEYTGPLPLICQLRDMKRRGQKVGKGFYDYENGKPTHVWEELERRVGNRGSRVHSKGMIVEYCLKAIHRKAVELVDMCIVATAEEADLGFIFGIGFAPDLGGPIFYGTQEGWTA